MNQTTLPETETPTLTKDWSTEEIYELLELTPSGTSSSSPVQEEEEKKESQKKQEMAAKSSQTRLYKNPYAKLGLIGLTTGVGAIIIGLILLGWNSINLGKTATVSENQKEPEKEVEIQDPLVERNAELTGELALSRQKEQMKALKKELDQPRDPLPKPERASLPVEPKPVVVQTPNRPTAPKPKPVSYRQPPRRTSAKPITRPQPINHSRTSPSTLTPKKNPKDPFEQWEELTKLGSYSANVPLKEAEGKLANREKKRETLIAQTLAQSSTLTPDEILKAGQQVEVTLTTPIVWSKEAKQEEYFLVTLSEPLLNSQGQEMLPIGTEILFSVQEISENGLVIHQAIAILEGGREYLIPSNRLKLTAVNYQPLMAKKPNQRNMARADTATFMLGALENVGELANRATSSTITNNLGGFTQIQDYGSTNYLGGILEGGLERLNEQWQERNEQRYEQLQKQPNLWHLEAGQNLKLFVNRSFYLGETDEAPNSHRFNR